MKLQKLMLMYYLFVIKYRHWAIRSQILFVFLGSPLFFYFDSPEFNTTMPYGQWISNYIMFWTYVWIYWFASPRLKAIMLLGTVVGLGLENFGSMLIGGYAYRLGNIPLYIPMGHSVIIATIYNIHKEKFIYKNANWLNPILYFLAVLLSLWSLVVQNDRMGIILFIVFLVLLQHTKYKLTHLIGFFFCYYLEVSGTRVQAWTWYSALGTHPSWPQIANPSPGIGSAYLILHLLTFNGYLLLKHYSQKKTFFRPIVLDKQ